MTVAVLEVVARPGAADSGTVVGRRSTRDAFPAVRFKFWTVVGEGAGEGTMIGCHTNAGSGAICGSGNALPVAASSCRTSSSVTGGNVSSSAPSPACAKASAKSPVSPVAFAGDARGCRGTARESTAVWIILALAFRRLALTQQGSCRTLRNAGASSIARIAFNTASASARASSFSTALWSRLAARVASAARST